MCTKRDVVIFFAGAEAFHTLIHCVFSLSNNTPIKFFAITITPDLNIAAIILNAAITVLLLWWASKL